MTIQSTFSLEPSFINDNNSYLLITALECHYTKTPYKGTQ